ncbi:AbrB/MazE/SpoVT family DNA-binding domain-containing protein [Pleurocapsales cyanobacterium LEGE 10410]|nr:AbrB/MazE/SpoVT family DNA-binding domain-containing protein [Pleurocapsales cyanobacterium LEGE 10410]
MDYKAEVYKSGRITIPIEIRKQFQIAEGDILTIRQENGELKLITPQQALDHARQLVQPYLQSTESSVDKFLEWRREEGTREERDLASSEEA